MTKEQIEQALTDEKIEAAYFAFERAWDEFTGYSHQTRMFKAVSAMRELVMAALLSVETTPPQTCEEAFNKKHCWHGHPHPERRCCVCHARKIVYKTPAPAPVTDGGQP